MQKLSVVIITKNEEDFIKSAVQSALFADEVLILDSGSIDNTCAIAQKFGAKVLHQEWLGFGCQKNKAIELASNDWVFVLDADEKITGQLKDEIIEVLECPISDGFQVPRLNNFFGKDIKTCGLYPDYTIRLFNRNKGIFNNVPVHESVQIEGKVSKLKNYMTHMAYDSIDEFITKQNHYSSLNPKKRNIFKALLGPLWTFFKLYFIKLGFLDGRHGFIIAALYSQYTFWKYIK